MNHVTISRKELKRQMIAGKIFVLIFFVGILLIGLLLYQDYGLTWDDLAQVEIGETNFNYVFKGDPALFELKNRYYGPLFEMILFAITRNIADPARFFVRHLLTFLSFYTGLIFFYKLVKRITGRWLFGLIGCLMLLLSPRIFAHSFYNSKDIPFMAAFIIAIYTLITFLDKKTIPNVIIHAIASAVLISLRVPGIFVLALTVGMLIIELLFKTDKPPIKTWLPQIGLYLLITGGLTILFWPILWHDPINEFINALQQMSKFPWLGGVVYYRAQFVDAKQLPWHYIPVWMLITTPIIFFVFSGLGVLKEGLSFFLARGKITTP